MQTDIKAEFIRPSLVGRFSFFMRGKAPLVPVTDFADASHSKSAKSATTTVSYGIFSSENALSVNKSIHDRY